MKLKNKLQAPALVRENKKVGWEAGIAEGMEKKDCLGPGLVTGLVWELPC